MPAEPLPRPGTRVPPAMGLFRFDNNLERYAVDLARLLNRELIKHLESNELIHPG